MTSRTPTVFPVDTRQPVTPTSFSDYLHPPFIVVRPFRSADGPSWVSAQFWAARGGADDPMAASSFELTSRPFGLRKPDPRAVSRLRFSLAPSEHELKADARLKLVLARFARRFKLKQGEVSPQLRDLVAAMVESVVAGTSPVQIFYCHRPEDYYRLLLELHGLACGDHGIDFNPRAVLAAALRLARASSVPGLIGHQDAITEVMGELAAA